MEVTLPLQSLDLMQKILGETSLAGSFPGYNGMYPVAELCSGGGGESASPLSLLYKKKKRYFNYVC